MIPPYHKGGSTPRNRAQRFVYQESDTPGPSDYDAKPPKCVQVDPRPIPGKGRLYACRVPFTIHASAPSIPTEVDANGYDLDEDGNIVKIPLDERDKSIGPAYYKMVSEKKDLHIIVTVKIVQSEVHNTISHAKSSTFCEFYRGCKWSNRSSKRSPPKVDETPGPGAYDVQLPKCRKTREEDEFREMARLFSFVPRFTEAQQLRVQKEGLPGPADYDIRKYKLCDGCPGIHPRPFIVGSERFKPSVSDTPSPDTYHVATVEYPVSKKFIPFSVQSSRFGGKKPVVTPGPGSYEIESPINEKLRRKKNMFAIFEPPFNQTSPRDMSCVKKDAHFTPSPADYTLNGEGKCKIHPTSIFKSKVERVKKTCKSKTVSPAHYDAIEGFRKIRDPRSHNVVGVSFNSTSERKKITENLENPGPADYLSQGDIKGKCYVIPVSPRFRDLYADLPGPGAYDGFGSALTYKIFAGRKSHFASIEESMAAKKFMPTFKGPFLESGHMKCFLLSHPYILSNVGSSATYISA
ncbi:hypothetical protein NQ318_019698 [Aromia moschata]|uniref:Sperm-tail PG-rich repeat-containing protein 2 n=1 Tax=Aromia moschata TaxID=1265417 RepID=A0AAV8Z423_9CUCU|nr:hypothetical protein NQ318_019698 [Aromia moschata]